jgi:hypothetical protein
MYTMIICPKCNRMWDQPTQVCDQASGGCGHIVPQEPDAKPAEELTLHGTLKEIEAQTEELEKHSG